MKVKIIAIAAVLVVLIAAVDIVPRLDIVKNDNSYVDDGDGGEGAQGGLGGGSSIRDLYDPDWETDITTLDGYLARNPYFVKYGVFNGKLVEVSETLTDRNKCKQRGGDALALMYDYFDAVRMGDHEALNALFAEGYFNEEKEPYESFPMQKVYDIFVRRYEYEVPEHPDAVYYLVTYKIMENDGLFRREVDADAELPQLFGVEPNEDGEQRIYLMFDLPGFEL